MEFLIKRINRKSENSNENVVVKPHDFIDYNTKKHNILLRLEIILDNEKKKLYYKKTVLRLFKYLLIYLEKIKSKSIKIINKSGKKYYYTNRLYLKDAEQFFLNTDKSISTKYYYLNIIRKYIRILNKNIHINFTKSLRLIQTKKKRNPFKSNIRKVIQKLKEVNDVEFLCSFYIVYFLGLSFYQFSKLTLKNYSSNKKSLVFFSYKFKRKIIKKKKILKQMEQYFEKIFGNNNKKTGFLFYDHIKDEKRNTRKFQIEKIFENFFTKKLKLSYNETKDYMEELNEERCTKRIGGVFKYLFEPYIEIIDDSNIFN